MKKLFVIGNGFDAYHGLKTQYSDFHRFISNNYNDLETILDNYFTFQVDDNYLWQNFESDLSSFDHESFFSTYNNIDILDDSFRPSDVFGMEDEINEESENLIQKVKDAFLDWIESIECPEMETIKRKVLFFPPGSTFINFNYTDMLEMIYDIPKHNILYLHNRANEISGDLIFGHAQKTESDPEPDELDANGDSNRTMFTESQKAARFPFYAFQKDTNEVLKRHQAFFEKLKEVNEVVVLGHSFGSVDWPYFREIASQALNAKWKISYYYEYEKAFIEESAKSILGNVGIELIRIEDLVTGNYA